MNNKRILKYVKCCVNLYCVISIQEIINTIKHYEENGPTRKEVQCVIENFITPRTFIQLKHNLAYNKKNVDDATVIAFHKACENMPFYYPDYLESFFKYESSSYYEETAGYGYLFELFYEAYEDYTDAAEKAHREMDWIGGISRMGIDPNDILKEILDYPDYREFFSDKNRSEQLLDILNIIHRNARIHYNKGYTLNELGR